MEGTSNAQKEVVVVGWGLVGALQAILLSQRGLRVRIYESRSDKDTKKEDSRWSINLTLSDCGRKALRAVGLEQAVLDIAIPMTERKIHLVSGKTCAVPIRTNDTPLYSIERKLLIELLQKKVDDIPEISVNFQHKLIEADLDKKKLRFLTSDAKVVDVADGFNFIFGCDGTHSIIRQQMMRCNSCSQHYSKQYSDYGFKVLTLPPTKDGHYAIEKNFVHGWPREEFMMIALPKLDKSFSLILFMPFKISDKIKVENDVLPFFTEHFPDVVDKVGVDALIRDYFKNPLCQVTTVKCFPHFMAKSTLILGDAAHGFVPFNGMNAGFEDCLIFYNLLEQADNDLCVAAQNYQDSHWSDTHAISDLSILDYLEMRSYAKSSSFLLGKK